jgi:hypothetical protein
LAIICITIFSSCERITFEDYALIEYDGQLTWQLETEEADWPDRIDPEVVVFQNKLWVMGGYNPGEMKGASTPIDFDPNLMQLPVRDDFIFSAAVEPLHFLKKSTTNVVRVYGDLGFFWPGVDFLGTRQNKPNKHAFMNYQAGMEGEYYFNKEYFGGLYAGVNVSAYQSNAFSRNISINAGYIIPQDRYKKRLRMGVHFYNGRPLSNQFYNRKEEFVAFSLCMDM